MLLLGIYNKSGPYPVDLPMRTAFLNFKDCHHVVVLL